MSDERTGALAQALRARAGELTDAVLKRMYENRFWHARFGERADVHGQKDGHFHLDYLAQALRAGDEGVMVHYAQWLRTLLVSRGMCTRHLQENLMLLGEEVARLGLPGGARAVAVLNAAAAGLRHEAGPAAALQAAAGSLSQRAVGRIASAQPALYGGREDWRRVCEDDARYHFEYAADALASSRPELFAEYLRFIRGFLGGVGVPGAHLDLMLDAQRAVLAEDGHAEAVALWDAARAP